MASVKTLGSKRVLRSWLTRRMRLAFAAALIEKGYDRTGKWVKVDESGKDLVGTANLLISPAAIKMKPEELKRQSILFINSVVRKSGRPPSADGRDGQKSWSKKSKSKDANNVSTANARHGTKS